MLVRQRSFASNAQKGSLANSISKDSWLGSSVRGQHLNLVGGQGTRPCQAQSGAPHLQRGFYRLSEKGRPEQQPPSNWATTVDDELPTLAEVFSRVPQHIGFDIEVCFSVHSDAVRPDDQPLTWRWSACSCRLLQMHWTPHRFDSHGVSLCSLDTHSVMHWEGVACKSFGYPLKLWLVMSPPSMALSRSADPDQIKMTTPDSVERTAPAEVERIVSAVLGSMAYMGTSSRTLIVGILSLGRHNTAYLLLASF